MPTKTDKIPTKRSTRLKRVTLRDIAEVAGVHVMTVSDALNNTRSVAPATRARVKAIAKEMNYVPNSAARALVTGRTGIIAVLSGILSEPYYANIVHLLEDSISDAGLHMMLMRSKKEIEGVVNASISVDGIIAVDRPSLVEELKSLPKVPCVAIGTRSLPGVDNILIDLSASVAEVLCLMLAAGRERIAYLVTSPIMEQDSEVRARVYRATMKSANRTPEIINVRADEIHVVERRFREYLLQNGAPDALFCQNDETAMCAFHVIKSLGYKVPDDVLLVGCDGQLHMKYFDPPLSTIIQPLVPICDTAWEFLQRRINQPDLPLQNATFEGELIITASLVSPN